MLPTLITELVASSSAETGVLSGADLYASPHWQRVPSDREESEQHEIALDEHPNLEASISDLDYEDEEKTVESLRGETLAWLDMEAGTQPEAFEPELTETEWFEPESMQSEWQEDAREQAHEATANHGAETLTTDMATLEALLEAEIGTGGLADRLKGVAAFVLGPTLQRGSSSPAVEALQRALAQLGYSPGAVDGRFGPATDQAVRAFQSKSGLVADGVVGARTKAAIAAALGGGVAPTPPAPTPPTSLPPSPMPPTPPAPSGESMNEFTTRLGAEWSRRRGGKPSAEEKRDALRSDYKDTLEGARLRFSTKYSEEAIRRAWMISREDEMRFQTELSGGSLGDFGPPVRKVELVSHASIGGSDKAPVAPIMVRFVSELRQRYGASVSVGTYRGPAAAASTIAAIRSTCSSAAATRVASIAATMPCACCARLTTQRRRCRRNGGCSTTTSRSPTR
jgi:hypothetical protein